jgi:hypothetical protein
MTPAELFDWLDAVDAPSDVLQAVQNLLDGAREPSGHPLFPDLVDAKLERKALLKEAAVRVDSLHRLCRRILELETDDLDAVSTQIFTEGIAQQGRRIKRRLKKLLKEMGELPPLHP